VKQLERLSEREAKTLRAEIRAARPVLKLLKTILEERIEKLYIDQVTILSNPSALAGNVLSIQELKKMTNLLQETEE
jgi:hypothetical protein